MGGKPRTPSEYSSAWAELWVVPSPSNVECLTCTADVAIGEHVVVLGRAEVGGFAILCSGPCAAKWMIDNLEWLP